ncbi:MAG: ABC transporter permease [Chloroflexi bacterium]|nr:ABC transporter permease [Chloroflexota bacterium]
MTSRLVTMDFLPFILRRATRHWQILLTLSLGVVLTTALLASGPLLVDAVIEMGLYRTLQSSGAVESNLRLTTNARVDQAGFQNLNRDIQTLMRNAVGEHLDRIAWLAESPSMLIWTGSRVTERIVFRSYDGFQDRVEYVAGEWLQRPSDDPQVIRVVVGDGMARSFGLRVGDRLPLSQAENSAVPTVWIEVVGIVRPRDPLDPYWFGEFNPLSTNQPGSYSVIVSGDNFFAIVSKLFFGDKLNFAWHVLLRHDSFSAGDTESFQKQLAALDRQLYAHVPYVMLRTSVPVILASFQKQLDSIRLPLYILIAEIILLGLYFVTLITALSMHQVEREFAILRSRGALSWQIVRIQLVEAIIILAIAFLIGPWVGASFVKALSSVGPLADVRQVADWGLRLSQNAWLAAGIGILVCLAGLLLPIGPALRRSIVTQQQITVRNSSSPWWQRLYLDVFLLIGGIILLWRLRLYGEMTTGGPGGARLDWLLLLSPVALLLGTATVLLRVFPLILRAFAILAGRQRGLVGVLALWQASRNPTHVARLVLLLTLAIALGNLSTGLNSTLDQSEYDRANYVAGTDIRLASNSAVPLVDLQSAPGVQRLSGAWRGTGTVNLESAQKHPGFDILAIDPESFSTVTQYRTDFADQPMSMLLNELQVPRGQNPSLMVLPGEPAKFGFWLQGRVEDKAEQNSYQRGINGDDDAERVGVAAKLQTAQGELFTVRLQRPEITSQAALQTDRFTLNMNVGGRDVELNFRLRPDNKGWHYFEGSLPVMPPSSYPLNLHSLWFDNQATQLGEPIPKALILIADDLTVVDAKTKQTHIVEDFESSTRPLFLGVLQGLSMYSGVVTFAVDTFSHSGKFGQQIELRYNRPVQTFPIRLRYDLSKEPLPALVSPTFIETTQLKIGDLVRTSVNSAEIDFRIAGTVRYFPTMYEQSESGFVITSRDRLLPLLNEKSQSPINPNEVFIDTDGSTPIETLSPQIPQLSQSWRAETVRQTLKANPLALGLRSVTLLGSALTLVLSLVGFATHFYLTTRQREMFFGIMRALGMSSRQLYGSLVVEQAILILAGLVLGTGLGTLLNEITLPRLPVQLADQPPVPPFVPREDWLAIGWLYLGLGIAFLLMLSIVTSLLWRARIDRIMRIGQE